ncbi:MAG: sulfatase-like hydrolase/transferase, partial [Planctomycetota bacterium]
MRTTQWIFLVLFLSCSWILHSCGSDKDGPVSREEAAKHPLVVVLLCDTLRRDALSAYADHRGGETPHIDSLAADGTRFEQAISTSGWTLPSVASILSGTYPSVHGASGRGARFNAISPELPLGQEVLKSQGWRTLAYINAAFLSGDLGMSRGFDLFDHEEVYVANIRRADV